MLKIIKSNERKYNMEIATVCGLREAVIANLLKDMQFCGSKMKALDGKTWVKCSQKTMTDHLPFLSEEMVRNSVRKLEAKGIISIDILDEDKLDRTYWYAFTDYGEELLRDGGIYERLAKSARYKSVVS